MKTTSFQRFNQPEIVSGIAIDLLHEFFHRFEEDFKTRQVPLPSLTLSEADYYKSASALLGNQETLPEALVEALFAIEEMAAPEQSQRREAAFWESPEDLWIDGKSSPENVALHLWLWSPYQPAQTAACPSASSASAPEPAANLAPCDTAPPVPASTASSLGQPSTIPPSETADSVPPPLTPKPRTRSRSPSPSALAPAVLPGSSATEPLPATPKAEGSGHRRNGKVAQLRKADRDKVNEMMEDGFTYPEIIRELAKDGVKLNEVNLCHWRPGGHQDWLRAKAKRESVQAREEFTMDLVRENTGTTIQQAGRQIASTHICELLVDLDHASLGQAIATNPTAFTRLLNALSRLTADELACARYRAEEAERQAQLQKEQAPQIPPEDRSITPETLHRIEEMLRLR